MYIYIYIYVAQLHVDVHYMMRLTSMWCPCQAQSDRVRSEAQSKTHFRMMSR